MPSTSSTLIRNVFFTRKPHFSTLQIENCDTTEVISRTETNGDATATNGRQFSLLEVQAALANAQSSVVETSAEVPVVIPEAIPIVSVFDGVDSQSGASTAAGELDEHTQNP